MKRLKTLFLYLTYYPYRTLALGVVLLLSAGLEFVSLSLFVPILEYIQQDGLQRANNVIVNVVLDVFGVLGIEASLFNLLLFAFLASVFQFVMVFWQNALTAQLFFPVRKKIRDECFNNLMDSSIAYFTNKKSGETVNVMTERIDTVGYTINTFILLVADGLLAIAYVLFVLLVSWKISALVLVLAFIKYLMTTAFVHRSRFLGEEWLKKGKEQTSRLLESIQGIRLIKSFSREAHEKKRFAATTESYANIQIQYTMNEEWMKLWDSILGPLAFFAIILVSVNMLKLGGSYILVYLFTLMKMIPKLTKINVNRNQLSVNLANTDAILDLLDKSNKPYVQTGEARMEEFNREVFFDQVSFSYQAKENVLDAVSFVIQKGKRVAIVGASGSGKSTLINLFLHLYDPTQGTILVDGKDLRTFDLASWHQLLGFVDQDTFIFNDTVFTNIAYGKLEATEAEVIAAAKKAHIHEFILTLEKGYQTILGERGVKFSGGQRQRIAIARSIIKKPQILIFDEATSSLDSISEEMIKQSIDEISRECTTILVAHRLSTVRNADCILVLEKGKIVESGNHAQLMERDGKYRQYHEAQVEVS